MHKYQRIHTKEIVLLLLPVLLLAGVALFFHGTESKSVERRLEIAQIDVRPLPSYQRNERWVGMILKFHCVGGDEAWWNKADNGAHLQNLRFVDTKGKEFTIYSGSFSGGAFNSELQMMTYEVRCAVPAGYDITQRGKLKGTAIVANDKMQRMGFLRFSSAIQLS